MSIPVKGSDSNTYQVQQASLGEGDKSAGVAVTLPTNGNHAKSADLAALQSALLTALGLLATDQDVMAGNAKLEAIRLLLATPTIPGGAATDVSVQAITAKLEAVRLLLATPALPAGAAADASVQAVTAKLEAIRALQAAPALATGAATEATLQAIKTAILAQVDFANLIVTDGTSYYVRRETVAEATGAVTVSFTTLAGAAASPNTASLAPVTASGSGGAASTRVVETALFDVTTAGTGTSVGDVIARVLVYDTAANTVVASYWHNLTTGAALATAPAAGAIVGQARNLPVGAAKDATLQLLLALLPASLGAKLTAASLSVAPATDALFTVAGAAAAGVAPTNPPLSVSGVDGGGLKRHLLTDTAGIVQVAANGVAKVGGNTARVFASFTRPANTTAYASGQLVANSTAAGSVTPIPLPVARVNGGTCAIPTVKLSKSSTSVANASFRVHLYRNAPTATNGDGGAWLTTSSIYLGYADITMDKVFTDEASGTGVVKDTAGNPRTLLTDTAAGSQNIYALIEARGAYTPASAETFTLTAEVAQD